MFYLESKGSFAKTEAFLRKATRPNIASILNSCGALGVRALSSKTPSETGLAAHSWYFEVKSSSGVYEITWKNSDVENGFPVVIMLQYGHGTGTGGYVAGQDFINPAMRPVFDEIANRVWKAVTS